MDYPPRTASYFSPRDPARVKSGVHTTTCTFMAPSFASTNTAAVMDVAAKYLMSDDDLPPPQAPPPPRRRLVESSSSTPPMRMRQAVLLRTLREIPVYVMPRGTHTMLYTASCFDGLGIRPLRLFCNALLVETPMKLRTLAGNASSWSSLVVGQVGQKPSEQLSNHDIGAWGERTVQSLAERASLEWSLRHPSLSYLFLDRYGWDLRIRVREKWIYAQVKVSCADDHEIARMAERNFVFLGARW